MKENVIQIILFISIINKTPKGFVREKYDLAIRVTLENECLS